MKNIQRGIITPSYLFDSLKIYLNSFPLYKNIERYEIMFRIISSLGFITLSERRKYIRRIDILRSRLTYAGYLIHYKRGIYKIMKKIPYSLLIFQLENECREIKEIKRQIEEDSILGISSS